MDATTLNASEVKKKAIINGVILGIISLVLSIISLYFLTSAKSLILSSVVNVIINYVIFLAAAIYFILQLRKAIGGYWDFTTALKNIFIIS